MITEKIFSRHMKFMGEENFIKIRQAIILVAGLGGLGSVVSELLVRLGVGKLILVDHQKVDVPDLNRQQLYTSEDIGKLKTRAAIERLSKIHSFTDLLPLNVDVRNITEIAKTIKINQVNGMADCLDNYASRFALEQQITSQLFLVHGGVKEDFGQVTTVLEAGKLAALYSGEADDHKIIPVSPVIVQSIGALMVQEILNNICGKPQLYNEMLVFELDGFRLSRIKVKV